MQDARAVQKAILQDFPYVDIAVSIIWINMLELDDQVEAERSAQMVDDPRVHHFHDPEKRAGKVLAQSLGEQDKVAWDIYLFYEAGSKWDSMPPAPISWAHQLKESSWADDVHYHYGDDLVKELHRTMQRLMST